MKFLTNKSYFYLVKVQIVLIDHLQAQQGGLENSRFMPAWRFRFWTYRRGSENAIHFFPKLELSWHKPHFVRETCVCILLHCVEIGPIKIASHISAPQNVLCDLIRISRTREDLTKKVLVISRMAAQRRGGKIDQVYKSSDLDLVQWKLLCGLLSAVIMIQGPLDRG